jgi:hypothetical protein
MRSKRLILSFILCVALAFLAFYGATPVGAAGPTAWDEVGPPATWCGKEVRFYSDPAHTNHVGTWKTSPEDCGCELMVQEGQAAQYSVVYGPYNVCPD